MASSQIISFFPLESAIFSFLLSTILQKSMRLGGQIMEYVQRLENWEFFITSYMIAPQKGGKNLSQQYDTHLGLVHGTCILWYGQKTGAKLEIQINGCHGIIQSQFLEKVSRVSFQRISKFYQCQTWDLKTLRTHGPHTAVLPRPLNVISCQDNQRVIFSHHL